MEQIKKTVSSSGVLEFRITANREDPRHRRLIELGERSPAELIVEGGSPKGRWVQVDTEKMDATERRGLVERVQPDGRVEALVELDRFNVTGGYLTRATATTDNYGDFKFDRLDEGSGRYTVEISGLGRKKTVEAELGVSLNLGEIRL